MNAGQTTQAKSASGKHRLLILGAGGLGRSLAEVAKLQGLYEAVGFLDDSAKLQGSTCSGLPIFGRLSSLADWREQAEWVAVGIGNNSARNEACERALAAGYKLATIVHPWTFIAPSATLGAGTVVMAGAVIGTAAQIGTGVIVNAGAAMDHDTVVEDFGHLGVNACMAGGSQLGPRAWLQCGASLGAGVKMPEGAVLYPGEERRHSDE